MRVPLQRVTDLLSVGEIELLGLMPDASNYTFAVRVSRDDLSALAVYKPQRGETPLWDFPDGTLYAREIAAFAVSAALGWDLVPPTILREGPHGIGSLQLFIDAEPEHHYLTLRDAMPEVFRLVAAFDVVINNADRKSGHCLLEKETAHLWVVDHGVCFHVEEKLRTLIWDFAGDPIDEAARADLTRLLEQLAGGALCRTLETLLSPEEVAALRARTQMLLEQGRLPEVPQDRRPYPWPPI